MIISDTRLKHLISIAKHGHFGLAAQSLKISQPALSKSIQGLEAVLGVKLLDRDRSGVVLTRFGELVLQHGDQLLHRQEEMLREIRLLANLDIGLVRVMLGPYPSIVSGYPAAGRLLAKHPRLSLSLQVQAWRDVINSVMEEKTDFGVAELSNWEADPRLVGEVLGEHCGRAFCRPDHPLLNKGPRSLADLSAYPWATTRIPGRVANSFPPGPVTAGRIDPLNGDFVPAIELTVPMNLALFVTGTDVLAFASLAVMEAELDAGIVLPVPGFTFNTRYGFVHLKTRSLSPASLAYMAEIRAVEAEFVEREKQLAVRYKDLLE
jgi:DNA-binding transcriptional LysR family regulator